MLKIQENTEEYENRLSDEKREIIVEDLRFFKMVTDSVEDNIDKLPEKITRETANVEDNIDKSQENNPRETAKKLIDVYKKIVQYFKNIKAKKYNFWKEKKKDHFYFIKVLEESGLYHYSFDELKKICEDLKELFDGELNKDIKISVIELLKFLYEREEAKDKSNKKIEMVELMQICGISEDDLSQLPDDISTTNTKGLFKNDIIEYLTERQKNTIAQMSVEEIRSVIDEYVNNGQSKPKYLNEYINRLKTMNALDLVTIFKLINRGDMQNSDVIEFAINRDIDLTELNRFIYDDPKKAPNILKDFSEALQVKRLIELYKELRNCSKKEKNAKQEDFENYAKLFSLYKTDKDGREIETFLKAFKKLRRDQKTPLSKDEVVYLYEIGLISGKYAFQPNEFINILDRNGKKQGDKVDQVRKNIALTIIRKGKLRIEDANGLFKGEIENIYKKNNVVTQEMIEKTLLGQFFAECTEDQKMNILLACDFSDEIDGDLIQWYIPNFVERLHSNKQRTKSSEQQDIKGKHNEGKKDYIKIPFKKRYLEIVGLNIPKLSISINNGVAYAVSTECNIIVIEQLCISKNGDKLLQPGEHPSYVMKYDYYKKCIETNKEIRRTIKAGDETQVIFDFNMLFRYYMKEEKDGIIKRVPHKVPENNPKRKVKPWGDSLKEAIQQLSEIKIDFDKDTREKGEELS